MPVIQWKCLCLVALVSLPASTVTQAVNYGTVPSEVQQVEATRQNKIKQTINYRLPSTILPKNYEIRLWPNMPTNSTFYGKIKILLHVLKPTDNITLHANNLSFNTIVLTKSKQNTNVSIESVEQTKDMREFLIIHLEKEISEDFYELHMEYKGNLNTLIGLYQSNLKHGRSMVASKFQPTYARQAFPCFDEPDFKATFDISLVKPLSHTALSNMNIYSESINEDGKTVTVIFEKTPRMSTYLACFVICDFDYKSAPIDTTNIGKPFLLRAFAQKDQLHKVDFALDIGKRATEFYIRYYRVPFPLPKLDMIGIPDYVSGATEHWGLITYRETSFLVDMTSASAQNKMSVANTIAHELAHMWFGNYVTVKWWDEIWLNEGFASYMQVKALNAIEPTWGMLDNFLVDTLHSVLMIDAKLSSHAIVQTVETPDQITAMFDAISYSKGASIIRMLEDFMGEEQFRLGVTQYLRRYLYDNAVTDDLYLCLQRYFITEGPLVRLSSIMDTWTKQTGYPVLHVSEGETPNTYTICQKRFMLDPHAYASELYVNSRWYIPITYKTSSGENQRILWFPDDVDTMHFTIGNGDSWLKVNNNQIGYYRVNYTDQLWEKLIHLLKTKAKELTASDRAHLLNDVFALAFAQMNAYDLALELSTYLSVESDYVPWATAKTIFHQLAVKLYNTDAHNDLQKYVQTLVQPIYGEQSWDRSDDISVSEGLLRSHILALATKYKLPDALERTNRLLHEWLYDGKEIEPELRGFVYFNGMISASQADWEKLWQKLLIEEDVQEKAKIRVALAAPMDTEILKRYLNLAWDENNVRAQDYLSLLAQVSYNPNGTALVWDEVRMRWMQLVDRYTLNNRYLGNLIPQITETFNTEQRLDEMKEFFAQYPLAGAGKAARIQALETVRNNIRWGEVNRKMVASWLRERVKSL